jgi:hypothetical protein
MRSSEGSTFILDTIFSVIRSLSIRLVQKAPLTPGTCYQRLYHQRRRGYLRHHCRHGSGCVYSRGDVTQFVGLLCVGETYCGKFAPRCEPGEGKAAPRLELDACATAPSVPRTAQIKASRNSFIRTHRTPAPCRSPQRSFLPTLPEANN